MNGIMVPIMTSMIQGMDDSALYPFLSKAVLQPGLKRLALAGLNGVGHVTIGHTIYVVQESKINGMTRNFHHRNYQGSSHN